MLDLQTDAVHAFWDSYDRRTLYRIIVALEEVEHWTLDSAAEVDSLLIALGESLGSLTDFELDEKAMMRVLASTRASRALRILQALDMVKPGSASQLLMYAEEATDDKAGQIFLRRNLVFERLQLLSRVFAPQRLAILLKALEPQDE